MKTDSLRAALPNICFFRKRIDSQGFKRHSCSRGRSLRAVVVLRICGQPNRNGDGRHCRYFGTRSYRYGNASVCSSSKSEESNRNRYQRRSLRDRQTARSGRGLKSNEGRRHKRIMELTDGVGCDIYMEATGNPASVETGMNCLRNRECSLFTACLRKSGNRP